MKDWLKRLQIRLWLNEVRRQTGGANNYMLDRLFSSEPGASSADRRKEFDFIERKAKPPRPDVLRRADVVAPGTRLMYEARFWTQLRDTNVTAAQCEAEVSELLERYGLTRLHWLEARQQMFPTRDVDERSVYNAGLKQSLRELSWYDGLSLLLALYKEAKGSSSFAVIETVCHELDRTIELAMPKFLPWAEAADAHADLLSLCLNANTAFDRTDASALLARQASASKVVLPQRLIEDGTGA